MNETHTYAIFSAQYLPHTGGAEIFTSRLAHQLALRGNRVFIVTSMTEQAPSHEIQDDGVEVYRLPCYSLMNGRLPISRKNAAYKRMMADLEAQGIDRVMVNTRFYMHSLEGVRFAKRIGARALVLDHGSAHIMLGNPLADKVIERYEHSITERVKRCDPLFAGVSHASIEWLRHFGIDTSIVIPNAIDADDFRDSASERDFREELQLSDDQIIVSFVGRLEPEKGALEFAQAARLLDDSYVCVMAGEGSQRNAIAALGNDNLHLLGRLDQPDLSALLRDSRVFCLPTRSEGFCTALLEAAAQSAIPVMPRVGGTDEIMGWDPVRFGVILDESTPACIARSVQEAAAQDDVPAEHVAQSIASKCSWEGATEALEDAFTSN